MFTGKSTEKEIVMQMNLIDESLCPLDIIGVYPESILMCSDGSVIAGHGKVEISIVSWFPSFEMLEFYSGDEWGVIDIDFYAAEVPSIEYLNVNYLVTGPI